MTVHVISLWSGRCVLLRRRGREVKYESTGVVLSDIQPHTVDCNTVSGVPLNSVTLSLSVSPHRSADTGSSED